MLTFHKRILSQEHKNKLSKSLSNRSLSQEHKDNIAIYRRKIISQYATENIKLATFECADEAVKILGLKSAAYIRKCASGQNATAYGFVWKYDEE
jgi:hypothetical protein